MSNEALRIFTWIVPRVNSTALTKCMTFVDDTVVWFEPYVSCHLNETYYNPEWKKGDPLVEKMKEGTLKAMKNPKVGEFFGGVMAEAAQHDNLIAQENFTHQWVKEQLESPESEKRFIFIKDPAYAIFDHLDSLPENVPTRHIFLIRHPREVYTSYKNIARNNIGVFTPKSWDECHAAKDMYYIPVPEFYQIQHKLWKHVQENLDTDAIVIDGHDLAKEPEAILPKLFEKLGIPFKESYLKWPADPETVYSSWRGSPITVILPSYTDLTSRAVSCTQFEAPMNPRGTHRPEWRITDEIKEYIEGAMPFYEEMYANRLT